MSVMVRNGCIYAGCQDGLVRVWDLATRSLVRSIVVKENADVLSLSVIDSDLYTCLSDGEIQVGSIPFYAIDHVCLMSFAVQIAMVWLLRMHRILESTRRDRAIFHHCSANYFPYI